MTGIRAFSQCIHIGLNIAADMLGFVMFEIHSVHFTSDAGAWPTPDQYEHRVFRTAATFHRGCPMTGRGRGRLKRIGR